MKRLHSLALVTLFFVFLLMRPSSAAAQFSHYFEGTIEGSPKSLIVGDKVDLTVKVHVENNKPVTIDRKYKFKILNPKPGQECFTTDNNLKDDGVIRGYCEAKGDSGNMEIVTEPEEKSTVSIDGTTYETWLGHHYNAMFYETRDYCASGAVAPSSVALIKQNDIAVRVDWQHVDKFVGTYEVLYGNKPGEYTGKRSLVDKSIIIDSLDSNKEYYFKVQAVSACKWTAASNVYKYIPMTGSVSLASEKPKTSPSPSVSPKPSVKPTVLKQNPIDIATDSAQAATMEAQPSTPPEARPSTPPTQPLYKRIWHSISGFFSRLKN